MTSRPQRPYTRSVKTSPLENVPAMRCITAAL